MRSCPSRNKLVVRVIFQLLLTLHTTYYAECESVKAKVFVLEKHFEGYPKEGDLRLVEEELPEIQTGEFLAEAVYLSVDPYMRKYSESLKPGDTFLGEQVARIIESKNPQYPVGQYVASRFGWRTRTISDGKTVTLVSKRDDLPLSLALGVLGMPGNTAYIGFLDVCNPRAGETVVVTGAGGAVGSHVGQIAKIKGCKVVGVAGTDEKGKWIVNELGFDGFINYKTSNVEKALSDLAPEGVDCYFDNVGGEISNTVLRHMNKFGRVTLCGAISTYNVDGASRSVIRPPSSKNVTVVQFAVMQRRDKWNEATEQNYKWIKEGKLKYRETVTEGFENTFKAFVDMLKGGNIGKAIVKV